MAVGINPMIICSPAMAKNAAYKLLKEHTTAVELTMKTSLEWFATRLSTDQFPVLDNDLASSVKDPLSPLQPHHKATQMLQQLLNWVDLDPSGLGKFVEVLKTEPVKYKILIEKLDMSKFR
jgi:hypothetical protein